MFYNPALKKALVTGTAGRGVNRTWRSVRHLGARLRGARDTKLARLGTDDVLVVPDIIYPDVVDLFPGTKVIVAVQVIRGLARAFNRDLVKTPSGEPLALSRCHAFLASSESCRDAVRTVAGREPLMVPLHVGFDGLDYTETKKRQIAYMPRKLPLDASIVTSVLKRAPELEGHSFQPIHGMKSPQVVEILK